MRDLVLLKLMTCSFICMEKNEWKRYEIENKNSLPNCFIKHVKIRSLEGR